MIRLFRHFRHRRALLAAEAAQAEYNAACSRNDTRAMHRTWKALRAARVATLRVEVR